MNRTKWEKTSESDSARLSGGDATSWVCPKKSLRICVEWTVLTSAASNEESGTSL
jgi:hypothetical protein